MAFPPVPRETGIVERDVKSLFLFLERLRSLSVDEIRTTLEDSGDVTLITVGNALTDTATVNFTFTPVPVSITADVNPGSITASQLANGSITLAKLADITANSLLGNIGSLGPVETIVLNPDLEFFLTLLRVAAFTGDVTKAAGGTILTIANNVVTLAKLQQISTDVLLGRDTFGTGNVELISLASDLLFTGSGSIQVAAFTGDIIKNAGSSATTIANNVVTFAKIQQLNTDRLIGRDTAAVGNAEEISLTGGLGFTGSQSIQINDNGVTYAKIQDVTAASRVLGRGSAAGSGDPQELTTGIGLEISGTVLQTTRTITSLASNFSTTSTTIAAVTGLDITVPTGTYRVDATLFMDSGSGTGVRFSLGGTATVSSTVYELQLWNGTADTLVFTDRHTTFGGSSGTSPAGFVAFFGRIFGTVVVSATGTLVPGFALDSGSGTAFVLAGSNFLVEKIG